MKNRILVIAVIVIAVLVWFTFTPVSYATSTQVEMEYAEISKDSVEVIKTGKLSEYTQRAIWEIATHAADGNEKIGALIAEAFNRVGLKGAITIEESEEPMYSSIDVVKGIEFNQGYISPEFVTDSEKKIAELEKPYILLYSGKISYEDSLSFLLRIRKDIVERNGSLLIIAENVENPALKSLVERKKDGSLRNAAVENPGFGRGDKIGILQDIAYLTGGTEISEDIGLYLQNVVFEDLGSAFKVKIDNDNTIIIDGGGQLDLIERRIQYLRQQTEGATSGFIWEQLQNRLQKLAGGVAVVYVGANSKEQMKVNIKQAENALRATRSAIDEGVVR